MSLEPIQETSLEDLNSASRTTIHLSWTKVLARFLHDAGLSQALRGFENDVLVLNAESEEDKVFPALAQMYLDLVILAGDTSSQGPNIEDQKLDFVHKANGQPATPHAELLSTLQSLIQSNRSRINASNRSEFLRKRRRISEDELNEDSDTAPEYLPTCARADMIPINRDMQMKYDVAQNDGGALRRTINRDDDTLSKHRTGGSAEPLESKAALQRHPDHQERFENIETHLAVRYVPSPPVDLCDRISCLEQHIMHIEREYPPWAALHFNQPNREWPPPPPVTSIVVTPHLTWGESATGADLESPGGNNGTSASTGQPRTKTKGKRKANSSLHRAVMEKLEVKRALEGVDGLLPTR